jgi:hypothetical protein
MALAKYQQENADLHAGTHSRVTKLHDVAVQNHEEQRELVQESVG